VRYGFGLPPFEEIRRKRTRPSEILENPQTIGQHLKRERQLRKMFQKDVARELGVNQWTLIGWEKGTKQISQPSFIPRVIEWLGYDPCPTAQTEGEELRQARLRRGLTTRQAAKEAGVDQGTWLRFENDRDVSDNTRKRLLPQKSTGSKNQIDNP
jgi:DNA-binding XRE family transcriptional regulator